MPWLSDCGSGLSRGFHAPRAWIAFSEYEMANYGRLIQQDIDQAPSLARQVESAPQLELAFPVSLYVVNFRFTGTGIPDANLNDVNTRIDVEIQEQGIAVLSAECIGVKAIVHVAVHNLCSQNEDSDLLVSVVIRIDHEIS